VPESGYSPEDANRRSKIEDLRGDVPPCGVLSVVDFLPSLGLGFVALIGSVAGVLLSQRRLTFPALMDQGVISDLTERRATAKAGIQKAQQAFDDARAGYKISEATPEKNRSLELYESEIAKWRDMLKQADRQEFRYQVRATAVGLALYVAVGTALGFLFSTITVFQITGTAVAPPILALLVGFAWPNYLGALAKAKGSVDVGTKALDRLTDEFTKALDDTKDQLKTLNIPVTTGTGNAVPHADAARAIDATKMEIKKRAEDAKKSFNVQAAMLR
jgi:hypothetical protein